MGTHGPYRRPGGGAGPPDAAVGGKAGIFPVGKLPDAVPPDVQPLPRFPPAVRPGDPGQKYGLSHGAVRQVPCPVLLAGEAVPVCGVHRLLRQGRHGVDGKN